MANKKPQGFIERFLEKRQKEKMKLMILEHLYAQESLSRSSLRVVLQSLDLLDRTLGVNDPRAIPDEVGCLTSDLVSQGLCSLDRDIFHVTATGQAFIYPRYKKDFRRVLFALYNLGGAESQGPCLSSGVADRLKIHPSIVRAFCSIMCRKGFAIHDGEGYFTITHLGISEVGRLRFPFTYTARVFVRRHGVALIALVIAALSALFTAFIAASSVYINFIKPHP